MMLTKDQKRQRVQLCLLMAEINALKKSIIEVYEQNESLRDPLLIKLSQILDRKLNELTQLQRKK